VWFFLASFPLCFRVLEEPPWLSKLVIWKSTPSIKTDHIKEEEEEEKEQGMEKT
jgi:hypothetical protein